MKFVKLIGPGVVANSLAPAETEASGEPYKSAQELSLWASLSPEKAKRAKATIAAMAEKFSVKEDDIILVKTEEDGEKLVKAVYAGNGIDLGDHDKGYDKRRSYNVVMAKKDDKNFIVEVDGKKLDTRTGMTEATYRALVADAKARGITLPDSAQMSKENNDVRTWTLLTGESADDSFARFASVNGGEPCFLWYDRAYDVRNVRFRPAVVIE